jgi:hypothetical protein
MTVLPLDAIKIGKRHRADLGDIKQLAHNIAEIVGSCILSSSRRTAALSPARAV